MDFLDSLLNGQRNKRDQYQRDMMQGFTDSRVVNMTPKGIQFTQPDTRVSSMLARQAVRGSTGMDSPRSMNITAGNAIGFAQADGEAFHRLTAAGIKQGSTMFDVMEALSSNQQPSRNKKSQVPTSAQALRQPNLALQPNTGNGYPNNNNQISATQAHLDGYNGQRPDSLNDLQLDSFLQEQHKSFQQLLHSALFSDY